MARRALRAGEDMRHSTPQQLGQSGTLAACEGTQDEATIRGSGARYTALRARLLSFCPFLGNGDRRTWTAWWGGSGVLRCTMCIAVEQTHAEKVPLPHLLWWTTILIFFITHPSLPTPQSGNGKKKKLGCLCGLCQQEKRLPLPRGKLRSLRFPTITTT